MSRNPTPPPPQAFLCKFWLTRNTASIDSQYLKILANQDINEKKFDNKPKLDWTFIILGYLILILLDQNQFRLTSHFLQSVVSYIKKRLEKHSQCSSLQSEIAFGQVKQQVKLEDQTIRLTHTLMSAPISLIRYDFFSVVLLTPKYYNFFICTQLLHLLS